VRSGPLPPSERVVSLVMAEAAVLLVFAAAVVAEVESVVAFGDVGMMASVGCTARWAVGDLDGWGSLQKPRDRKAHAAVEVVAVAAAVRVDPGDIHFLTLFHLVPWNIPIEFARM
jgi:hypothetical protein